jgi:cellulose synthase (UDP-forming)
MIQQILCSRRSVRLGITLGCWTVLVGLLLGIPIQSDAKAPPSSSDLYIRQVDDLSALWSFYKQKYVLSGRVVSWDENGITTSEGQGYAMLRAVWAKDHPTFAGVWKWTKQNLQVRPDKLFAWKWKGKVVSLNSATDADTDIALALILAARRFDEPAYEREALVILDALWNTEVLTIGERSFVTAGNWAPKEAYPTIHVAYLAPYAYEVFATVDQRHPWKQLIETSYAILHWLYVEKDLPLPPEILFLDKRTGGFLLKHPETGAVSQFGYDAVPLFWRVALDAEWFGRNQTDLRRRMLAFFWHEWQARHKFFDQYTLIGEPQSVFEGLPLYATVHALALRDHPDLARVIGETKLNTLHAKAIEGKDTPYYLHNWLWFGRAFELHLLRTYDEFLGFLRPFDFKGFSAHFPWELFAVTIGLYLVARYHPVLKVAFLSCGLLLCGRYLKWRFSTTLNLVESAGPVISLSLWIAELYAFSTVVLLFLQVGLGRNRPRGEPPHTPAGFAPSVDIFIPIYSESCDILEKTLIGACAIEYANTRVFLLDDGHRAEVAEMAAAYGITYIKGPRQHAKAGNLNHALAQTNGELVVVFDTDHIPTTDFLKETVPSFADPTVAFVQTPHHFYNQDIFQRALCAGPRIPNEQDLFNHAIQGGRAPWNGAFFVGSGAVFRRRAIAQINGFNLMSITEDIHTSQHLHARGWRSVFVNKDLAVGLTAENLSSYIVQRRRWMLGCLQIFFKDNPLLCRGLTLRQRLGYFASLYYFFFPVARVVFWITPLYYLLFHLHPIFSEVSVLLAYLIPFMIILPLMSSTLLPGWPRLLWASVYEIPVCFPLFRSMFDLLLPKRLGFKVTPKGLTSDRRAFAWRSSTALVFATVVTVIAIGKGLAEFFYFGIEKDAYFFNLSWASLNVLFLLAGLLIAWEKPQRRVEERIRKPVPFVLRGDDHFILHGHTADISLSGIAFFTETVDAIPPDVTVTLHDRIPITCRCRIVYHERVARHRFRCGLALLDVDPETRRTFILNLFTDPGTWRTAHDTHIRNHIVMAGHFLRGLAKAVRPPRRTTRRCIRRKTWRLQQAHVDSHTRRVVLRNRSPRGIGVWCIGWTPSCTSPWRLVGQEPDQMRFRPIYRRRILPFVWSIGLQAEPPPASTLEEYAQAVPVSSERSHP